MRHSTFWNSIAPRGQRPIAKSCPQVILGGALAVVSGLAMIAPVVAQTAPAITIINQTTTSSISQGGAATYKITVTNAAGAGAASNVNIIDVLPTSFTFDATTSIAYTGSASRDPNGLTNPSSGSTSPSWNNFLIPAGGSVTITFTANNNPDFFPNTYQNPASVT